MREKNITTNDGNEGIILIPNMIKMKERVRRELAWHGMAWHGISQRIIFRKLDAFAFTCTFLSLSPLFTCFTEQNHFWLCIKSSAHISNTMQNIGNHLQSCFSVSASKFFSIRLCDAKTRSFSLSLSLYRCHSSTVGGERKLYVVDLHVKNKEKIRNPNNF